MFISKLHELELNNVKIFDKLFSLRFVYVRAILHRDNLMVTSRWFWPRVLLAGRSGIFRGSWVFLIGILSGNKINGSILSEGERVLEKI